jgi:hypothetical protein
VGTIRAGKNVSGPDNATRSDVRLSCISSLITEWEKVVPILSAMLTPAIALLATYIAWQQHKINKDQFRLGLFERRLKLFDSAGKLIATVIGSGKVADANLKEFLWDTKESEFLFGSDIKAYLADLYGKASDVYTLENAADEPQKNQRKQTLLWFSGQGDGLKKKFGKYMAFRENDWRSLRTVAAFIILITVTIGIYAYEEKHAPQRVFLTRSQRYQNEYGVKSQDDIVEDDSLDAEQRLSFLMSGNPRCIVLTNNKNQANYIVEITVERHPTDLLGHFADAMLSITKRNGDIFLIGSFYQDSKSTDDIAQQPITKTWEVLCSKSTH